MRNLLFTLALCLTNAAAADTMMIADLSDTREQGQWRFFTDQVMGGQSTGDARFATGALTLAGNVSTVNRGGFIQVRRDLDAPLPKETGGLQITVRGDGQDYFIHLRTAATRLPWQYYQARFTAPTDWTEISLPFDTFAPSGALLPARPNPASLRSVALVAYGRDHKAQVAIARISTLPKEAAVGN